MRILSENWLSPRKFRGGGGDSGGTTESTSYQTNLPEYAEPYYREMMRRAQRESLRPYEAYEGPRIAGFSDAQLGAQQGFLDLQSPDAIASASDLMQQTADRAANTGTYQPTTFTNTFTAEQIDPGTFDSAAAQQYMSPYMQNVIDISKREAMRDADIMRNSIGADAATAGAFGGDRHGIMEAELDRNTLQQLSDMQVTGLQSAYEDAQRMFGQDRAARMQAEQQYQADRQAEASMNMSAQELQEAAKQFGATYEQQQQNIMNQIAQSQATLGQLEQDLEMARLEAQNAVGAEQQAMAQKILDQKYEEFINARDNERQNLAFYNALLRGIPVPTQQEVIQYTPGASTASQAIGAGIAGLGAYMYK